jgi:hypothetical protein
MYSNKYSHNWKNQCCWNTDVPCAISIGAPKKKKIFAKNNLKIKGAPNSVRVANDAGGIGAGAIYLVVIYIVYLYTVYPSSFIYIYLPSSLSSSLYPSLSPLHLNLPTTGFQNGEAHRKVWSALPIAIKIL